MNVEVNCTDRKSTLRCRQRIQTDNEPFSCSVDENTFKEKNTFDDHLCEDVVAKPFVCAVCLKGFSKKRGLELHSRIHTADEKPVIEKSVCRTEHTSKDEFDILQRRLDDTPPSVQANGKRFVCNVCEKKYMSRRSLKAHRRKHDGEMYICPLCKRECNSKYSLADHVQRHSSEKPFLCEKCGKRFPLKSDLSVHAKIHANRLKMVCNICHKILSKHSIKYHSKIHTGEKGYVCQICQKKFIGITGLRVHLRTHTGEKPFVCDFCPKSFSKSTYLKEHQCIDTAEKLYCCEICRERFTTRSRYQSHLITHMRSSNEKSLKIRAHRYHAAGNLLICEFCDKTFSTNSCLQQHLRKHRPYGCRICEESFLNHSELQTHLANHSSETAEAGDIFNKKCEPMHFNC